MGLTACSVHRYTPSAEFAKPEKKKAAPKKKKEVIEEPDEDEEVHCCPAPDPCKFSAAYLDLTSPHCDCSVTCINAPMLAALDAWQGHLHNGRT